MLFNKKKNANYKNNSNNALFTYSQAQKQQ